MAKPFSLTFHYTPKWKRNRTREASDQFTVTLRDLQESKRVAEQERLILSLGAVTKDADGKEKTDGAELVVVLSKEKLHLVKDLVEKHVVSIDNLSVLNDAGEEIEVKDFAKLWEYCSDVVAEISARLLSGPDADELKN